MVTLVKAPDELYAKLSVGPSGSLMLVSRPELLKFHFSSWGLVYVNVPLLFFTRVPMSLGGLTKVVPLPASKSRVPPLPSTQV